MTERMRQALADQRERAAEARERAVEARENATERAVAVRASATEKAAEARLAAGEARDAAKDRALEARDAASEQLAAVREAAGIVIERRKPKLRGVFHQWAFPVSLIAGVVLVIAASRGHAVLAVYAGSLSALLGVSALYHRIQWQPRGRALMRRLDHSMIFILIAATYTPFALYVADGGLAETMVYVAWGGAIAGIIFKVFWISQPKWVSALAFAALGWSLAMGMPGIVAEAGPGPLYFLLGGGILYMVGGVIYARQSPDPRPTVFGYHEIMHLLVIAAAAVHFAAVAIYAAPA